MPEPEHTDYMWALDMARDLVMRLHEEVATQDSETAQMLAELASTLESLMGQLEMSMTPKDRSVN